MSSYKAKDIQVLEGLEPVQATGDVYRLDLTAGPASSGLGNPGQLRR